MRIEWSTVLFSHRSIMIFPEKKTFTARRLDYILSTDAILNNIHDCSVHSVAQSDHRLVNILYNISHVQRGPSYWKFNESLLHDQTFVEQLNSFFEEFKKR